MESLGEIIDRKGPEQSPKAQQNLAVEQMRNQQKRPKKPEV